MPVRKWHVVQFLLASGLSKKQQSVHGSLQSWALSVFLIFSKIKFFFCNFYQVNLTGSGHFKYRTRAEIGY